MSGRSAQAAGSKGRFGFLLTPGWLVGILLVLLFAASCFAILAPWQFARHDERSAENAQIAAAVDAPVGRAEAAVPVDAPPSATALWRAVTATGTFRPEGQVFVRLRQDDRGRPVSEVVVPLDLADGTVLLVDRGYVELTESGVGADLRLPAGPVTVTGRVQALQPDPLGRPASLQDGRTVVTGIDASIGASGGTGNGLVVRQGFVQLVAGSPGALQPIGTPQLDGGPYLSYAWQWITFGVIALVGMGVLISREAAHPREQDDPRDPRNDPPSDAPSLPGGPAPALESAGRARRGRPARDGFDRSQLYD